MWREMDEIESATPKPTWGWLYAIVTAMSGILVVIDVAVPEGLARRTLELVVTAVMFAAMVLWVHVNRGALAATEGGGRPRRGRRSST